MEQQPTTLITKYSSLAEVMWPRLMAWSLDLAAALGIFILGWIVARLASGLVRRVLERQPRVDSTIKPVISAIIHHGIIVVAIVAAVAQVGIATTSILAVLGAAGLAIGLALQGTLSNVAAGFMLLVLRPVRVEEYVETDGGIAGTVKEVGIFNTLLESPDGIALFVPNAKLWGTTIRNYSRLGRRRFEIEVRVAYEADVEEAQRTLLEVMKQDSRVRSGPEPAVIVSALVPEGTLTLAMQGWVISGDYAAAVAELRRAAKFAIDNAGIAMPFAQRTVYVAPQEIKAPQRATRA